MVQNVVNLPTHEQVTNVATNVESAKTKIDEVKLDTSNIITLVNTVGSTVNNGLGTDWGKYRPFFKRLSINVTPSPTVYKLAYQVTGKGYLSLASIPGVAVGTGAFLRISIDGVVVFEFSGNSAANQVGFYSKDETSTNQNGQLGFFDHYFALKMIVPNRAEYINVEQANKAFLATQPIFFNTELKIEVKAGNVGMTGVFEPFVSGGIIL